MKSSGSSAGHFGGSKPRYRIEEVENSTPVEYVVKNGLGLVVAGPFSSLDKAEKAREQLANSPSPQ